MKFWKMNGAGNDFIVLDAIKEDIPLKSIPEIAKTLCTRRFSIGADGLMVVCKATGRFTDADCSMLYYNSDGSLGEMCGNGARCICRYAFETGIVGETQRVESVAGLVIGQRVDERLYRLRLNDPSAVYLDYPVRVEGRSMACSYVELGDPYIPHAVVPVENLAERSDSELRALGRAIRFAHEFPKGANVNFYEITGPNRVLERTYERGVEDLTYACGTGTGSLGVVLALKGLAGPGGIAVDMRGGTLVIDVELEGGRVVNLYKTGPTNIVAKGEVFDEDLFRSDKPGNQNAAADGLPHIGAGLCHVNGRCTAFDGCGKGEISS